LNDAALGLAWPDQGLGEPERLPVALLTGFLGSGKTTLLSRLLRHPGMARTAVIINEFGEVPIDQALIERSDHQAMVLSGGCLCCALGQDLGETLTTLYSRRAAQPFDRVAIETSGLADPTPILQRLQQTPELHRIYRIDSVVATVDAIQGERELGRQRVSLKQVAIADQLVLTKGDIASRRAVERLQLLLADINPTAPIIRADAGDVDPDDFFPSARYENEDVRRWLPGAVHVRHDHACGTGEHKHHRSSHHNHGIISFCLRFDQPIRWEPFAEAMALLLQTHGERLLRVKGLVNVRGRTEPIVVQCVQHLFHPPFSLTAWPDGNRSSSLVFITDHLDQATVTSFLTGIMDRSNETRGPTPSPAPGEGSTRDAEVYASRIDG